MDPSASIITTMSVVAAAKPQAPATPWDRELIEIPVDHPVYSAYYRLPDGLPKIHKHDGGPAQGYGIFHEGRLVLFYSFESDLGNGWEDADQHELTPQLRESAVRMGINLFVYALAQVAP